MSQIGEFREIDFANNEAVIGIGLQGLRVVPVFNARSFVQTLPPASIVVGEFPLPRDLPA